MILLFPFDSLVDDEVTYFTYFHHIGFVNLDSSGENFPSSFEQTPTYFLHIPLLHNNIHSQSSYKNFIQMNFNKRQKNTSPLFSCQHFTCDNLSNAYAFSLCNFNPPNPTDICSGKFSNRFSLSLILFFPFPQQNTNYLTLLVSVNSVF